MVWACGKNGLSPLYPVNRFMGCHHCILSTGAWAVITVSCLQVHGLSPLYPVYRCMGCHHCILCTGAWAVTTVSCLQEHGLSKLYSVYRFMGCHHCILSTFAWAVTTVSCLQVRGLAPLAVELGFLLEEYAGSKGTYPPKRRNKKSANQTMLFR